MTYHQRCNPHLARDADRMGGTPLGGTPPGGVPLGGTPLWLAFRILPALLFVTLSSLLLTATAARAQPAGAGVEPVAESSVAPNLKELASGHLLLQDETTGGYIVAVMQASKVHFDISGMIATVTVEQSFRNDTDRWMEGVYAFPLPDNAAVRYMDMLIGERRIVGKIREKAIAKKIYQEARKAGKKASLVEQQRPNLFTNRVANIGPGEEISVLLEYVQQVDFVAGEFSLRFPTTVTPRYMPGAPLTPAEEEGELVVDPYLGWAVPTDQVPDAAAISPLLNPAEGSERAPINPIAITARLDMGMPLADVQAPYHDVSLARRAGVYNIRLANGVSEMDRDFVLTWQPVTGSAPAAALFTEQVEGEHFGLLMVVPPAVGRDTPVLAREIIFVVDTSGSMGGVSIKQARESMSRALQQLQPQDRFNIIEFDSSYRALHRAPVNASRHHVQQAQEFVRQLRASGGTEMMSALRAALEPAEAGESPEQQALLRQVIFITDGAVGNEVALFEQISARLGHSRLFTVGIGSAPNSWFMREAARFGRGTHTHIGDIDEVGEKMAALFDQLSRPAAVNFAITWPSQVEAWPERVPDLYQGEPLLVAVNFGSAAPLGEVVVSAAIDGKPWRKQLQLASGADPATAAQHKGVASLWARQKITGLLDQKVLGASEESVRSEVLPVALKHQLLSPYTSFVAVEEVVSRPLVEPLDKTAVANTRPRGQSPQGYAYPRTATTGPAKAYLGALLLFLALMVRVLRQPEVDRVPLAPV